MGTNYYLHYKSDFDPLHRLPATVGLFSEHADEPIELKNGWLWRNKYYVTIESLNSEYYQEIHIGKSSLGWRFLLCAYPEVNPRFKDERWLEKPILSLDDWKVLFEKNKIFDEYNREVSKEEMLSIITDRRKSYSKDGQLLQHINDKYVLNTDIEGLQDYDLILSGNDPKVCEVFC